MVVVSIEWLIKQQTQNRKSGIIESANFKRFVKKQGADDDKAHRSRENFRAS